MCRRGSCREYVFQGEVGGDTVIQEALRARSRKLESEVPRPSKNVEALAPYDAVSSLAAIKSLPKGVVPLKLDWNESAIPPSPRVIEAITGFLSNGHHLNWYPELNAPRVRAALSNYTGVRPDSILVSNGSDDALDLVCRTYLEPGDDVIVAWPTYGHFLIYVKARGVQPRLALSEDPFAVPTSTILEMIRPETKLVYLPSPNNPTGTVTSPGDIASLCRAFPGTMFLVDEAYYEFCGVTSASLVASFPNLVVVRTFSKCFGIAGLRVGYLMTGSVVMQNLRKLYNPKSVNALAQIGAVAALEDVDSREAYVAQVRASREQFATALRRRGAEVHVTQANFILVRVRDPQRLVMALESAGVFVRDRSRMEGFEGWVRFTVGTVSQMHDLVERIDVLLETCPGLLEPMAS